MKLNVSFFSFGLVALILVLSCSKDSSGPDNNTVTVSGKVTLEGLSDYSGVTVSLYAPVTLNPEIAAINQQYPNIGVKISQETEFDHRAGTAAYSATTNAAGEWSIGNVAKGTYNLVAQKSGFGWKYNLNLDCGSDRPGSNFDLLQEIEITAITSDYVFQSERHYILKNNLEVPTNVSLTFNNGVHLRLNPNVILRIRGAANFNNSSYAYILCDQVGSRYSRVELLSNNYTIKNLIVNAGNTGLGFTNTSNTKVEKCIIRNSLNGIYFNSGSNNQVLNNLVYDNQDGVSLVGTSHSLVQSNIIFSNEEIGLNNQQAENNSCLSNYFKSNKDALVFLESASGLVKNNVFDKNITFSITILGSKPAVRLNNFLNENIGLKVCSSYQQQSYLQSQPVISFNNFLVLSSYSIDLSGHPASPFVYGNNDANIDALHNFWNTPNDFDIQNKIWDHNDNNIILGVVSYAPFSSTLIDSAGIR